MDTPALLMTNAELAEAIAYTSGRISHVGTATEQHSAFCNHLRELLAIQRQRASMLAAAKGVPVTPPCSPPSARRGMES